MFEIRLSLHTKSNNEKSQNTVNKCFYSAIDYRSNIYALGECGLDAPSLQTIREQARSVGCIIDERQLPMKQSLYQLDSATPTLQNRLEKATHDEAKKHNMDIRFVPDEGEKFLDEPSVAHSTVTLVAKKIILTAAHVVCDPETGQLNSRFLANHRVVFDFIMRGNRTHQTTFPKEDVYSMRKVIAFQYKKDKGELIEDWAVIKLDREVVNRTPVRLGFSEKITMEQQLYMIGYPHGLPQKYTRNGFVKKDNSTTIFEARIDAFSGNSGSPIFDAESKQVVGILCRGKQDLVVDADQQGKWISHIRRLDSNSQIQAYEFCQKVTALFFVKHYILGHLQGPPDLDVLYNLADCYDTPNTGTIQDFLKGIKWLKKATDLGHPMSTVALGYCYLMGKGLEKDEIRGVAYLKKGADAKIPEALLLLGYCYWKGRGTAKNAKQAAECFRQASDKYTKATFFLGMFCLQGIGVAKDEAKGLELLNNIKDENEAAACFCVGQYFLFAIQGITTNRAEAVERIKKATEQHYPRLTERKTIINGRKAFKYFQKAAAAKLIEAFYCLGLFYSKGYCIERDELKAYECFQKAAQEGYVPAIHELGYCHFYGRGVLEDEKKAFEFFQSAAEKGHIDSFHYLGISYFKGIGTTKDAAKAVDWFKRAAEKNHKNATAKLAFCYCCGFAAFKDVETVIECMQLVAKEGDVYAINVMGEFYFNKGTEEDIRKAIKWYQQTIEITSWSFYRLGCCYEKLGEQATALSYFHRAAQSGSVKAHAKIQCIQQKPPQ